jgi:hypothetical protein
VRDDRRGGRHREMYAIETVARQRRPPHDTVTSTNRADVGYTNPPPERSTHASFALRRRVAGRRKRGPPGRRGIGACA